MAAEEQRELQPESSLPGHVRTWRESAGRQDGSEAYEFGDLSRSLGVKAVQGFRDVEEWATRPKQKDGYEFGDLVLKRGVRMVSCMLGRSPSSGGRDEEGIAEGREQVAPVAEAENLATELREKRQRAQELFEKHIPLLEARREALETASQAQAIVSAEELSARMRLKGTVGKSPVRRFQKALDDVMESHTVAPVIDADFVRSAASTGQLDAVVRTLEQVLNIAEDCERCSRDVGADGTS
jgi:hypothetical protein